MDSTTRTAADTPGPSTKGGGAGPPQGSPGSRVELGDIVLVKLDEGVRRPMMISALETVEVGGVMAQAGRRELRVSGTIFAEPEDHSTPAFRGLSDRADDPARIIGRPDRHFPLGYGAYLAEGMGIGQWITRPTKLPGRG